MTRSPSRRTITALLGTMPLMLLQGGSAAAQASESPPKLRSEAEQIALDAYVYGYSLITTEVTRVQMSNVDKIEGLHAPIGQFGNIKRYPPADYRGVSAPNADTLYSVAWLDLAEPQVFSHPDKAGRTTGGGFSRLNRRQDDNFQTILDSRRYHHRAYLAQGRVSPGRETVSRAQNMKDSS
jgi:hypothetical protein